uniref:Uncharacterized protein n=1 Tax=Arundo donax TaxID=35708 RepID=A0A0A9AAX1_ARUDO
MLSDHLMHGCLTLANPEHEHKLSMR